MLTEINIFLLCTVYERKAAYIFFVNLYFAFFCFFYSHDILYHISDEIKKINKRNTGQVFFLLPILKWWLMWVWTRLDSLLNFCVSGYTYTEETNRGIFFLGPANGDGPGGVATQRRRCTAGASGGGGAALLGLLAVRGPGQPARPPSDRVQPRRPLAGYSHRGGPSRVRRPALVAPAQVTPFTN